jgi:hypothetical protein
VEKLRKLEGYDGDSGGTLYGRASSSSLLILVKAMRAMAMVGGTSDGERDGRLAAQLFVRYVSRLLFCLALDLPCSFKRWKVTRNGKAGGLTRVSRDARSGWSMVK